MRLVSGLSWGDPRGSVGPIKVAQQEEGQENYSQVQHCSGMLRVIIRGGINTAGIYVEN